MHDRVEQSVQSFFDAFANPETAHLYSVLIPLNGYVLSRLGSLEQALEAAQGAADTHYLIATVSQGRRRLVTVHPRCCLRDMFLPGMQHVRTNMWIA